MGAPPQSRIGKESARVDWAGKGWCALMQAMSPSNRKYPNPFLFVGVSLASYAAFYYLIQHRQATYPASQQARQRDSPLIPPIHPEDLPKNKTH